MANLSPNEYNARLFPAPLRILYLHAWEIADRGFKLVGWAAIIALLFELEPAARSTEYRFFLGVLVALWLLASLHSVMNGFTHLQDALWDLYGEPRRRWIRLAIACVLTLACGLAATFMLKAAQTAFLEFVTTLAAFKSK